MEIKTLAVDLSKNFQHVCAFDKGGNLLSKKVYKTNAFSQLLLQAKPCTIIMEACGGAHHWARTAQESGHEPKLIAPKFVKRFVDHYKNDFNDARAIFEAASRPSARFVAIKSQHQQEITFLHRSRSRLLEDRIQLTNQLHAYVWELGYKAPKARNPLKKFVRDLCDETHSSLGSLIKTELFLMLEEFDQKDKRLKDIDLALVQIINTHPLAPKLIKIPGIGPITATALLAEVGDFNIFRNGREFAAWLGLVPKQNTTGGKIKLGPITKAGNRYLRRLLVHGARSLYAMSKRKEDNLPKSLQWMQDLCGRAHTNTAVVAMANKIARVVWAVIVHDREYDPTFVSKPPIFQKKKCA